MPREQIGAVLCRPVPKPESCDTKFVAGASEGSHLKRITLLLPRLQRHFDPPRLLRQIRHPVVPLQQCSTPAVLRRQLEVIRLLCVELCLECTHFTRMCRV
jgi:hypothetical protein